MRPTPDRDRVLFLAPLVGVDRGARVLRGYVVAQEGPFKSEGRGQFDRESLETIVRLGNERPTGLKSRFTHPGMSSDGLGSYLGRARDFRRDGDRVRADLHLDPTSFQTPQGNLGSYVLDLAESDPDALSSSLVLTTEKVQILDGKGRPKLDEKGKEIPPIWRPTKLLASDIVDTGDAVDGLLSAGVDVDGLPLGVLWRAHEALDRLFADQPREVVAARVLGFLDRYLHARYGPPPFPDTDTDWLRRRLKLLELARP